MPRKPRMFVEGGVYHVYCRTGRGEPVFLNDAEALGFIEVLQETKQRDGFIVYAWCLMSNHYHLALRTTGVPLWRSMASIQALTSKRFNRRHRVFGPLWQGRYKAKPVEDQRYLDQIVVYIHLNPVAAGIVENPAEHRLSGHRELVGLDDFGIIDRNEALAQFGPTVGRARRAYVRALAGESRRRVAGRAPRAASLVGPSPTRRRTGGRPPQGCPLRRLPGSQHGAGAAAPACGRLPRAGMRGSGGAPRGPGWSGQVEYGTRPARAGVGAGR